MGARRACSEGPVQVAAIGNTLPDKEFLTKQKDRPYCTQVVEQLKHVLFLSRVLPPF